MKYLLLILLILISVSSYSQYPATKKIGNDSVVIITLKQGQDINKRFVILTDSIKIMKRLLEESKQGSSPEAMLSDLNEMQAMYNRLMIEYNKRLEDSVNHEIIKTDLTDRLESSKLSNKIMLLMFFISTTVLFIIAKGPLG